MALYHLSVKPVSRGCGRSAVACAAYRCADVLHDERLGQTHDYERKRGVEAAFIMAPMEAAWAQERERLWNAAEAAEKRKDARVGREYELALPCELDREGRRELVEAFAGELVERFGVAVDAAIHAPGREGDQRNWHAHVLTTTRRMTPEGLGEKTEIELSDMARAKQGLGKAADEIEGLRAVWAGQVNRALEQARVAERVDHRSYARQGRAELEATQHAGPAVSGMERKAERQRVQAQARQAQERAQNAPEQVREAAAAAEGPGIALAAPERSQAGQERLQEGARAVAASKPVQGRQAVQDGLERPRTVQERAAALRPVESSTPGQDGPVRPAAGMHGSGAEPVTRVGQRNAEIQERNRALEAARRALEAAQRVLE
ncbi:MAG: MobA/MobL family protein, partial [Pseudomonadota bacterium]|nr:MobA/MobL family protein [Pseudomonadota bacterium]